MIRKPLCACLRIASPFQLTARAQTTVANFSNAAAAPAHLSSEEKSGIQILNVARDDSRKRLRVAFSNGTVGIFPYVWLRDCAPEPRTYENLGKEGERRVLHLSELDLSVHPENVSTLPKQGEEPLDMPSDVVHIQWPPYYEVSYPASFLLAYPFFCFKSDTPELSAEPKQKEPWELPVPWDRETMNNFTIPTAGAVELLHDDAKLDGFIRNFLHFGVVRIEGETWNKNTAQAVLERFGVPVEMMHTCTSITQAPDDLHTGMPYVDPPPRIAVIRMRSEPRGGCLQFVDGINVARQMEDAHPKDFRILCETSIEFAAIVGPRSGGKCEDSLGTPINVTMGAKSQTTFHNWARVFQLNESGDICRIVFNNSFRSSNIVVEGDSVKHLRTNFVKLADFYRSLKTFNKLCYDTHNLINVHVKKGDMFIIANDRVLYGNTALNNQEPNWVDESFVTLNGWDPIKRRLRELSANQ